MTFSNRNYVYRKREAAEKSNERIRMRWENARKREEKAIRENKEMYERIKKKDEELERLERQKEKEENDRMLRFWTPYPYLHMLKDLISLILPSFISARINSFIDRCYYIIGAGMFIICFPYIKLFAEVFYILAILPLWNGSVEIFGIGSSLKTLVGYVPSFKGNSKDVKTKFKALKEYFNFNNYTFK
jgi:hypothetical protein